MPTAAVPPPRSVVGPPGRRLGRAACVGLFILVFGAGVCLAHGGPPLRVGVTADPSLTAVGRLLLSHLREGVGFGVEWRGFADARALQSAFAAGTIDIAVGAALPGTTVPPAGGCAPETLAGMRESLRREWEGEVFLLSFPPGLSGCDRPALIVSRAVLEDLRFGILGKEAARFASVVTREDVVAVRAAAERGGERAAAAAARAAMAARTRR